MSVGPEPGYEIDDHIVCEEREDHDFAAEVAR